MSSSFRIANVKNNLFAAISVLGAKANYPTEVVRIYPYYEICSQKRTGISTAKWSYRVTFP